jgi:hypothetical protein
MLRGKTRRFLVYASTILTVLVGTVLLLPVSISRANSGPDSTASSEVFRTKCNMPRSRWCWLGGWKEHERSRPSIAGSPEIARCGTRSSHFKRQERYAFLQEFAQRGSDSRVGDAHSFAASKKVVRTPDAALPQVAIKVRFFDIESRL